MSAKRQEWQANKQGVVATEVEKEDVDSDKIKKPPEPTNEEFKEIYGFKNQSVHHNDGDDDVEFGFLKVGTNTEAFPMPIPQHQDSTRRMTPPCPWLMITG